MKKTIVTVCICIMSVYTFAQTIQEQLGTAISTGNVEAIGMLIKQGADPNKKIPIANTKYFENPLNSAILVNKPEIVEELLKNGADPNLKNPQGVTPIFATTSGIVFGKKYWLEELKDSVTADVKCAALLIEYKADVKGKWAGKTWAEQAKAYNHTALYNYAIKKGSK